MSSARNLPPGHVLLVDDDPAVIRLLEFELGEAGFSTIGVLDGRQAREALQKSDVDAIVLDLALPDSSGQALLQEFQDSELKIPVIVLTARDGVEDAVECMRLGARDFLSKPFQRARLLTTVRNAVESHRLEEQVKHFADERRKSEGLDTLVGTSPPIAAVKDLLQRAVDNDVTVLLQGESGTGKEVFARALHAEGDRAGAPFVAVNCGAIPESLIEGQLFGHVRGAFTGAIADHAGFFEQAEGGTILLDEIGELPLSAQVRLLRVLQDRTVQRVGDRNPRPVDVRVLAATNRKLEDMAREGSFRLDLFYRLAVFPITLPALRERGDDILLLAETFLERACTRHGRERLRLDDSAREALRSYPWPGNVRELENAIERACLLANGDLIRASNLPDPVLDQLVGESPAASAPVLGSTRQEGTIQPLAEAEKLHILHALEVTGWNLSQAAQQLGIGRATIYRKIERYGIDRADEAGDLR